jgi:hypothetical protein
MYSATSPPDFQTCIFSTFVSIQSFCLYSVMCWLKWQTKHGVCVRACVRACNIWDRPHQDPIHSLRSYGAVYLVYWYQCFGDEHYLKQSFKLNFTEAKLFHLKFLAFYKRGLIFSLAVNRTGFRFHSCWKKRWNWKASRKIALKICKAGQNLRFNSFEFVIIFMGIFTNNDKHFYLVTLKKKGFSYVIWIQKRHKTAKW